MLLFLPFLDFITIVAVICSISNATITIIIAIINVTTNINNKNKIYLFSCIAQDDDMPMFSTLSITLTLRIFKNAQNTHSYKEL